MTERRQAPSSSVTLSAPGAVATIASKVVGVGALYGLQLALSRTLGVQRFGLFSLALVVTQVLAIFCRLGFDSGALRFVAQYRADGQPEKVRALVGLASRVVFAVSGVCLLVTFVAVFTFLKTTTYGVALSGPRLCLLFAFPFMAFTAVLIATLRGARRVTAAAAIEGFVQPLLCLLLILIASLWRDELILSLGFLASWVCACGLAWRCVIALEEVRGSRRRAMKPLPTNRCPEVLPFSLFLLVISAVDVLTVYVDVLLLGHFRSETEVGYYVAAQRTAVGLTLILFASSLAYAPSGKVMLKNRDIVCVSTIDWDFLWQQHQAITSILARHGNRVLFIENTGVRPPGLRDLPRILQRLRKWTGGEGRFRPVMDNIFLFSPLALPFPYSPLAQKLNRALVCRKVRRWLDRNQFRNPILFSYLPTQFTLDLMDAITPSVSVYYCTTNFAESSAPARQIVRYESSVVARCDLVFVSASELLDLCRPHNPNVYFFPIGVSIEKFDEAWQGNGSVPPDIAPVKRPIVGYVGGLHRFVDQRLIGELSARLPEVNFVLVGPAQTSLDGLKNLPNVHLLGVKPHEEVPYYIRQFDVCLIPYVLDSFTTSVSPAKLNEYLALGKAVVSSDLPEVQQFNREHDNVVATASGVEDFIAHIRDALRDHSPHSRLKRRAVAQRNSWWNTVEEMSQLIEARLVEKQ